MKKSDRTIQLAAHLKTLASNKAECKYVTCRNIVNIVNEDHCYDELVEAIASRGKITKESAKAKAEWIRHLEELYDDRFGGMCGGAMDYLFLFTVRNRDTILKTKTYKVAMRNINGTYFMKKIGYREMSVNQLNIAFTASGKHRTDKAQIIMLKDYYAKVKSGVYKKVEVFNFNGLRYSTEELTDMLWLAASSHKDPLFSDGIRVGLEEVLRKLNLDFPKK